MIRLNCDYLEGAHPNILERLCKTNYEQTKPYGFDEITLSAKEKIKKACGLEEKGEVYFMVGGTQTNATMLDFILRNSEGVIAADTGHISVHEAGAIEYSGHKVITLPAVNGKVCPKAVETYLENFYKDATWFHMAIPGAIYISHPSEYGTLYTKEELKALRAVCDQYKLQLYLDGARLGYAVACENTDVTLPVIAEYCDCFCIGGTKVGALFGEAAVFTRKEDAMRFVTFIKQHGALLAKGRMLGIQFDELFEDDLYFKLGAHADKLAMKIRKAFLEKGYEMYSDSYTNQQFFLVTNEKLAEINEKVAVDDWGPVDDERHLIRITTSWATTQDMVDALIDLL
ncbi:MAG: aminotransferase class I/II-fold pyridoxal phosphate-dependent enzyme [Clostridia bacterium]|nr:aminotransferase class I/II-fold pyridoxal phosphate-dependent enzyme [Clostridia bacterium]